MADIHYDDDDDHHGDYPQTHSGFFHRSLSPASFERLRDEHSDYFYKPKRGPSTSKSNITITRPIKHLETVSKLFDLFSRGNPSHTTPVEDVEPVSHSKKLDDHGSTSNSSGLLSMDDGDLSCTNSSSAFSSRSNSSISTVTEQESVMVTIDELESDLIESGKQISSPLDPLPSKSKSLTISKDDRDQYSLSPCHAPAIGINITTTTVSLVLLELYPQNVDYSTILFQRYLISLIVEHEHENWSIANVELRTQLEQEANFRLFTLTREEFDRVLLHLQSFVNYNCSIASSFVLNIALTGEQTKEYEMKIAARLSKINLNFDIIQYRAESYMIGLEFFLSNRSMTDMSEQAELIEILDAHTSSKVVDHGQSYPYILIHAEAASTFFYIVHSSSQYSVLTSTNLCYQTYSNLLKLVQPGFGCLPCEPTPSPFANRRPVSASFDLTQNDLCKRCHRTSSFIPSQIPLTSLTRIPQRYFPSDYSNSKGSQYIYRGWSNRRCLADDQQRTAYDVPTQTDDSFLELSTVQTRSAMHRSLLSMFTMNMAVILKLLLKTYPSVTQCIITGEFFQLEKQSAHDLSSFIRSMLGQRTLHIYQLRRESLIAALGCALPRVYFDVIEEDGILGHDCIY